MQPVAPSTTLGQYSTGVLDDGRTVTILIPWQWQVVNKCNKHSKCTNWSCSQCYDASFASSPYAPYWHHGNGVVPRLVAKNSNSKFWFVCGTCGHEFDSTLNNVTKGQWCPYCANPPQRLCQHDNCQQCYSKSFASHPHAQHWHPAANGAVRPRDVFLNCTSKFWFACPVCGHPFDSALYNVSSGYWCPYCSDPPKQLCQYDTCQRCHSKSFASHLYAQHWHPTANGTVRPRDVFLNSNAKYNFSCHVCHHVFSSALSNIAAGQWCPACSSSSLERRAADQLQRRGWLPTTDITDGQPQCYMTQFSIGRRRYDLYLPSLRVVIELDGIQHFETVPFFTTPLQQQQLIDLCKNRAATQQGLAVVRISYRCDVEQCIDWVLQQPPLSAMVHFSQPWLYQAWHNINVTEQQYHSIIHDE